MTVAATLNGALRRVPSWLLYPALTVPGVWLFWLAVQNRLGADPVATLEHELGEFALQLLIVSLLITPLRDWLGLNLIRYRRAIGLMAFAYVCAHLLVYLVFDNQFWWDALIKDLTKRPYIIVGVAAFLILIPLAVTSNNLSIRKLGPKAWRRIHFGAYVAVILGAAHFVMLKKTWQTEPLVYLGIALALVAYRLPRLVR